MFPVIIKNVTNTPAVTTAKSERKFPAKFLMYIYKGLSHILVDYLGTIRDRQFNLYRVF